MKVLDTTCEFGTVFVCVLVCSAEAVTILCFSVADLCKQHCATL